MKNRMSGLVLMLAASLASAPPARAQDASVQGVWRSGEATIRVTVNGAEARAVFVELGTSARAMGFKVGDVSFVATVFENYLHGVQTIHYGSCYAEGRKVPVIARLSPNGQGLAMHNYLVTIDQNCRDTGEYQMQETVWQRVPGAR